MRHKPVYQALCTLIFFRCEAKRHNLDAGTCWHVHMISSRPVHPQIRQSFHTPLSSSHQSKVRRLNMHVIDLALYDASHTSFTKKGVSGARAWWRTCGTLTLRKTQITIIDLDARRRQPESSRSDSKVPGILSPRPVS